MNQSPVQIIEENEFFIVLVKPTGLSVHNQSPSVAEYLKAKKKPLHFVNRLDLETSGLMLVAKDPEWHNLLAEALEHGQKFYHALLRSPWKSTKTVTDTPAETKAKATAIWSWPISDKAEGYKNPQGVKDSRQDSESRVEVIRSNQYFTEVTVELITGRQHQIRKHAAIAKHPIVGDPRYNEEKYNKNITKFYQQTRMQLHAEKLKFEFNNKKYEFVNKINFNDFFVDVPKVDNKD